MHNNSYLNYPHYPYSFLDSLLRVRQSFDGIGEMECTSASFLFVDDVHFAKVVEGYGPVHRSSLRVCTFIQKLVFTSCIQ